MRAVQQNPDGLVIVTLDSLVYVDTPENLALDFGQALPALPAGADDRVYEPHIRHAIMSNSVVIDGGPMPWPFGDELLASVEKVLAAQANRRAPPAPTLDDLKRQKREAVKQQFLERAKSPITYNVGGQDHVWDADDEAIQNIMGYVTVIGTGAPTPNMRQWSPKGLQPIDISKQELVGLGVAIAVRKDVLFARKKQKQAEINSFWTADQVQNYDETASWE